MSAGKPRYQQLKDAIVKRIADGELQPGDRVPSENELVLAERISRMTANRALRELTDEGYVERIAGRGTYVADFRARSHVREVQNIADEIVQRGHTHSSQVVDLSLCNASESIARALHVDVRQPVFHSQVLHLENGIPVQFEDRHVLVEFAPDYLQQDFTAVTPGAYLTSIAPFQEAEQIVRAETPAAAVRSLLHMQASEPTLVVIRRTWVDGAPVTVANLHHPGKRYELTGHYQPSGTSNTTSDEVSQLETLRQ
jgi:GntR family histidine utilization transcriptional repressor